jgi:hypothetical protein
MNTRFTWEFGRIPPADEEVVLVRDGYRLQGWSRRPEGAARPEIEKGFADAFDFRGLHEEITFTATITKNDKLIDRWQFTLQPSVANP